MQSGSLFVQWWFMDTKSGLVLQLFESSGMIEPSSKSCSHCFGTCSSRAFDVMYLCVVAVMALAVVMMNMVSIMTQIISIIFAFVA